MVFDYDEEVEVQEIVETEVLLERDEQEKPYSQEPIEDTPSAQTNILEEPKQEPLKELEAETEPEIEIPQANYRICKNQDCNHASELRLRRPESKYCGGCGEETYEISAEESSIFTRVVYRSVSGLETKAESQDQATDEFPSKTEVQEVTTNNEDKKYSSPEWGDYDYDVRMKKFTEGLLSKLKEKHPGQKLVESWNIRGLIVTSHFFGDRVADIYDNYIKLNTSKYSAAAEESINELNEHFGSSYTIEKKFSR